MTEARDFFLARIIVQHLQGRIAQAAFWDIDDALKGEIIGITGSNGKTTTTALLAWILTSAGIKPSYMIGGIPKNLGKGALPTGGGGFTDVDADIYVMTDGDATYDPGYAAHMVNRLFEERLDMVVGTRVASHAAAYRTGHQFGNRLLTFAVANLFGKRFSDMLSGYRVFSRRFVKSFPAMSSGFEIETELTIHALELQLPVAEVVTPYRIRITGSTSKLRTYVDGLRIVRLIVVLYKNERPMRFFSAIGGVLLAVALGLGIPLVITFIKTGLVPRQPTAILATGLVLLSALGFIAGIILDTVTRGRLEMRRLAYLAVPPPDS
jgi:hypothetical protein